MNILYIIFGTDIIYHVQAYLSIRSFQKQLGDNDKIIVITTAPQYYRKCESAEVIGIDNAQIKEWKGSHDFFWRTKIKAIEYISKRYPNDPLLYLDTDTFLYGSLDNMKSDLSSGKGLMYLNEGHPSTMMTKSLRMWKQVSNKNYGGITITKKHDMWNAGVVGIPQNSIESVIQTALNVCDDMLDADTEKIVIEQYSLSIALSEKTQLTEAQNYIGHYWGNKEGWTKIASDFMLKAYMSDYTLEEELTHLDEIPFCKEPIYIHHSSTAKKLIKHINTIFPDKECKCVKD
jgi:hypothetical protein